MYTLLVKIVPKRIKKTVIHCKSKENFLFWFNIKDILRIYSH